MGRYWSNGYLRLIMERISSLFSPTIVAASIEKAFEYPVVGEATFTGVGLNTWTCPEGVYSVSVVCVAGGGTGRGYAQNSPSGGGGGALAYKNNISVVPGLTYNLQVGERGYWTPGGTSMLASNSWFGSESTVFAERGQAGRTASGPSNVQGIQQFGIGGQIFIGDGGGPGGNCGTATTTSQISNGLGGGGAGGYSGSGGSGGSSNSTVALNGTSGSGGAGGGGAGSVSSGAGAGGGVGLKGQGASGAGGLASAASSNVLIAGQPGSNGLPLVANTSGGTVYGIGGEYGGGGGGGYLRFSPGANGAVRIVWPAGFRTFPSQNLETHTVTQNLIPPIMLQVGVATSLKPISISGNIGPVVYAITPPIPSNTSLTFNTSTGTISGTPTSGYPESTFTITTIDSVGQSSSNSFLISIGATSGQIVFAGNTGGPTFTALQTTWTVPANVYSISAIAVGCGGSTLVRANGYTTLSGAGGGGTAFLNNYRVEPGQVFDIYVDNPQIGYGFVSTVSKMSYLGSSVLEAQAGGNPTASTYYGVRGSAGYFVAGDYGYSGGNGGNASTGFYKGGGGGAAGYAGDGGAGGQPLLSSGAGATGSGAGSGGAPSNVTTSSGKGGGGGGVGLLGQGTTGAARAYVANQAVGTHGTTGSNRGDVTNLVGTNLGADYGGGAGGGDYATLNSGAYGGKGAIRIIWPGTLRRYDANTRTTNE
jgi:hypothetical protein